MFEVVRKTLVIGFAQASVCTTDYNAGDAAIRLVIYKRIFNWLINLVETANSSICKEHSKSRMRVTNKIRL